MLATRSGTECQDTGHILFSVVEEFWGQGCNLVAVQVDTLSAMAKATNLEVTLQHLGPTFAATVGQSVVAGENLSQSGYEMPTF